MNKRIISILIICCIIAALLPAAAFAEDGEIAFRENVYKNGVPYSGATVEYRGGSGEKVSLTETASGVYQYIGAAPADRLSLYINGKRYNDYSISDGMTAITNTTKIFDVVFDPNGQQFTDGTKPTAPECYTSGMSVEDRITKPANPLAKDASYKFVGWTTGPEADSGEYDFTRTISNKTVIYAQWKNAADPNVFVVSAERSSIKGADFAERGKDYTAVLVPNSDYELPFRAPNSDLTSYTHVKIGGAILNASKYSLNCNTGEISIPGEYVTGDIEIVTVPKKHPFVVSFDANGGSGEQDEIRVYDNSSGYGYLGGSAFGWVYFPECTFTPPAGKEFAYWSYGVGYANRFQPGGYDRVMNDISYCPIWRDAPEGVCSVAYDLQGASFSGKTTVQEGSNYSCKVLPKDGYSYPIVLSQITVDGTPLNSSAYTFHAANGSISIPGTSVTGNISIKAGATAVYTVTFDNNGRGTKTDAQTVEGGKTVAGPVDPTAEGYLFGGWYRDKGCTEEFSFETPITENTTLYAKWNRIVADYHMIAGADGEWTKRSGVGLSFTSDAAFEKFEGVKVDDEPIAKDDYAAAEGSTKVTLKSDYLETLSEGAHSIEVISDNGSASANFTVLPAPPMITLTKSFGGDLSEIPAGATFTIQSSDGLINEVYTIGTGFAYDRGTGLYVKILELPEGEYTITETSYDMEGFTPHVSYKVNGGAVQEGDRVSVSLAMSEEVRISFSDRYVKDASVTFEMNGHGTQIEAQTVADNGKAEKPEDPAEEGYTFGGWYTDEKLSAEADFDAAITQDTVFYAKWTKDGSPADDPDSPKTGDYSNPLPWLALLIVSGVAMAGIAVYYRRKKAE